MSAFVIGIDTRINDGEDVEIVVPVLLTVDKIVLSDYCGYHYRIHGAQACAQKKEDAYFNVSCLYTWLYDKIKNSEYREALKPQIDQYDETALREVRTLLAGSGIGEDQIVYSDPW